MLFKELRYYSDPYESVKNLKLYELHYMSLYNSQTMIIKDDL